MGTAESGGANQHLSSSPQPFPQPLASVREHPLPIVDIRLHSFFPSIRQKSTKYGQCRTAANRTAKNS